MSATQANAATGPALLAAADPVMAELVDRLGELSFATRRRGGPRLDAFGVLVQSVIAQQVSARAAATVHGRVQALFGHESPSPLDLLAVGPEALRRTGLSGRKVSYLRDLATRVHDGGLDLDELSGLGDDEVIARISALRGFGVWSAQIFCINFLERPDVLPATDLGIRRAVADLYGLEALPGELELGAIAERWRPQRTLACIYLWESLREQAG